MDKEKYVNVVIKRLEDKYYDKLDTFLMHKNTTELFVAVLLSPQCTDKQVNIVTKELFKKYKSFKDYADANPRTLASDISGVNFYKTKARHLRESAKMIIKEFKGKPPLTMKHLMELPGVGRKVANVFLNEGFNIAEGIAIDTHCRRVSQRIGFSKHKTPEKIEVDMMRIVPKDKWKVASNLLIDLGRDTCQARTKFCERCVLKDICPSSTALKI